MQTVLGEDCREGLCEGLQMNLRSILEVDFSKPRKAKKRKKKIVEEPSSEAVFRCTRCDSIMSSDFVDGDRKMCALCIEREVSKGSTCIDSSRIAWDA